MRRLIVMSWLLALLFSGCAAEEADTTAASTPAATPKGRPNILLIIGDDMGFLTSAPSVVRSRRRTSTRWRVMA